MSEISNEARDIARRIDLTVAHYSPMENVNAQIIQQAIDAALSEQAIIPQDSLNGFHAFLSRRGVNWEKFNVSRVTGATLFQIEEMEDQLSEQAATIERLEEALKAVEQHAIFGWGYEEAHNKVIAALYPQLSEKEAP